MDADVYRVKIRFDKLFADPRIFDEPETLARRYLTAVGLSPTKAASIYQINDEIFPEDDTGKPSAVAGFATYQLDGKRLRSEFMVSANVILEYVDYSSGHSPADHESLWKKGRWDEMRFEMRELQHHRAKIELPAVFELYEMLKARGGPSTMATVELPNVGKDLFKPTVSYLEDRLKEYAEQDGRTVEVQAARELSSEERRALEKRLAREPSESTVYVILSKGEIP